MKRAILVVLSLLLAGCAFAATLNVSSAANYELKTAAGWTALGVTQPNAQWYLGSGLAQDTTNYGSSVLATGLTTGNEPSLAEGILAPHQSANEFNGSANYLVIRDKTVLRPDASGLFTILAIIRVPSDATLSRPIFGKYNSPLSNEYTSYLHTNGTYRPYYGDVGGVERAVSGGVTNIRDDKWRLIGFAADTVGVVDSVRVYVNGLQERGIVYLNPPIFQTGTDSFKIGGDSDSKCKSTIAWIGVWTGKALSNANIIAISNAMVPTGTTALPFPSIQSAIRQSTAADIISIASGTYQETVDITKALTIVAANTAYPNRPRLYGTGLPLTAGVDAIVNISSAAAAVSYLDIIGYATGCGTRDSLSATTGLWHHLLIDSCFVGYSAAATTLEPSLFYSTIDCESIANSVGLRTVNSSVGATELTVTDVSINNCATGVTQGTDWTVTENYNNFYGNTTARGVGVAVGANSIALFPKFKAPAIYDYRLQFSSPLRAGGADAGSLGFYYIGAYPATPPSGQGGMTWGGRGGWATTSYKWGRPE